jgi:hypothetical protein
MRIKEILNGLDKWDEDEIPADLLLDAVDAKEEITPHLIYAVEDVAKNPANYADEDASQLYYWAIYLLTHFQATEAFPAVIGLFAITKTDHKSLVFDIISEDGAMILSNLCGGNLDPICAILQDAEAPDESRSAAAVALGFLCLWGELEPERIEAEFRRALETLSEKDVFLGMELINGAVDLQLRGLAPDVTRAFDRGVVKQDDFDFVAEWLHDPDFEPPPPYMLLHQNIEDIVEFFEQKLEEERMLEEFGGDDGEDETETGI